MKMLIQLCTRCGCMSGFAVMTLLLSSCMNLDAMFLDAHRVDHYTYSVPADWPKERVIPDSQRREVWLQSEGGTRIFAVLAARPDDEVRAAPTVIYSYGRGGSIDDAWGRVSRLWALGANVVVYDYPGFGRSDGEPSESGVYEAARAALQFVRRDLEREVNQSRVFLYGVSMGSGAATELASTAPAEGLILESGFTSVTALASDAALVVPRSFTTRVVFDNLAKIRRAAALQTRGILFFHGEADDYVDTRYSREMYKEVVRAPAAGMARLVIVPGADHSNVPDVADSMAGLYSREVMQFLAP